MTYRQVGDNWTLQGFMKNETHTSKARVGTHLGAS